MPVLSPKVADLTDLTIANMTLKFFKEGALVMRVEPEKNTYAAESSTNSVTSGMTQAERDMKIFKYLSEQQAKDHEMKMRIIRSMGSGSGSGEYRYRYICNYNGCGYRYSY